MRIRNKELRQRRHRKQKTIKEAKRQAIAAAHDPKAATKTKPVTPAVSASKSSSEPKHIEASPTETKPAAPKPKATTEKTPAAKKPAKKPAAKPATTKAESKPKAKSTTKKTTTKAPSSED